MSAPVVDPPRQRTDAGWLFGLFSALFALALILDQLWWGGFELRWTHALVVATALWVLAAPASVPRFAAMNAATVVSVTLDLPGVGSHRLLMLIVGVCVLAHLAGSTLRARRPADPGAVFEAIAGFLRVSLLVVYAFAALAKLNTAFLDPALSSAGPMSREVLWFDPSLLDGPLPVGPAIWATILIEATLPVLLAIPATRPTALVLGAGFHSVLALAGNVPFTALVLALYVAFLPADTIEGLRRLLARRPGLTRRFDRLRLTPPTQTLGLGLAAGGWLLGAWQGPSNSFPGLLGTPAADLSPVLGGFARLAVVGLVVAATILLVGSRRALPDPSPSPPHSPRRRNPLLALGVLVLILNGMGPYLGVSTGTSFDMFSGLRTEPGAWNHLLVPEAVRILDSQN